MCATSGPKYFLPPNQLGSEGQMDAPLAYASSPQTTANAGTATPTPPAAPTPTPIKTNPPPTPPIINRPLGMPSSMFSLNGGSDLMRLMMNLY